MISDFIAFYEDVALYIINIIYYLTPQRHLTWKSSDLEHGGFKFQLYGLAQFLGLIFR